MDLGIAGKVAVITGASLGMGRIVAGMLADEGVSVAISDIKDDAGERVASEIRDRGGKAAYFHCDVADFDSTAKFVADARREFGPVGILVNVASLYVQPSPRFMDTRPDGPTGWRRIIEVCLLGAYNMTYHAARDMIEQKWGRLVYFASDGARSGEPDGGDHYGAKSGLLGFNMCMARELARHNITANVVSPGFTLTEHNVELVKKLPPDVVEKMLRRYPMRKFGDPIEVPNLVSFLVSEKARYLTGQTISVSGGYFMSS